MKKLLFVLLTVITVCPAFAFPSAALCADIGTVQDLFISKTSFQTCLDARFSMSGQFQLRLPMNFTFTNRGNLMFDAGLLLTAYPFGDCGFFAGMTIVQLGTYRKQIYALNEISVGWTFRIRDRLIIEPSVSFRDPSSTFKDEYSTVRGIFPCYTQIRVHLMLGWQIVKEEI